MSPEESTPSGTAFYIDPPSDLGPAQRLAWLEALADALERSENLELDVVTSEGGGWSVEPESDAVRTCRSKVVIIVNGRPCGPKLSDPGRTGQRSQFNHEVTQPLPPPAADA